MDKLSEHAIRMLEIVDGENDFFRNDNERQADIARAVYDVILQVQMLKMVDRKTEPSDSENSNNCEELNAYRKCEDEDEPLDKDINVRSKDCETCKYKNHNWWSNKCDPCCRGDSHYEPKDEHSGEVTEMVEPQTERHLPDYSYEADFGRRIMEQTDCAWKGEE